MTRAIRYIPLSSKVKTAHHWPRSFAGLMLYILLLALITGFGSAYWMLREPSPLGQEQAGAWTYWPDAGSIDADPYTLAIINRQALLPLGPGEGLELVAARDSTGARLRSNCSYQIGPTMPQARFWTLTAFDIRNKRPITNNLDRTGFTSSEIIRNEAGTFEISLSRQPQPGNWLQLPGSGQFVLVLRLYDVPATGTRATIDPNLAPTINRLECGE